MTTLPTPNYDAAAEDRLAADAARLDGELRPLTIADLAGWMPPAPPTAPPRSRSGRGGAQTRRKAAAR